MTPREVLGEIQKMPLAQKRRILLELTKQLSQAEPTSFNAKEKKFLDGLKQKGLITEMPLRLPDDDLRRCFKRIEVKGDPLSETIIQERG